MTNFFLYNHYFTFKIIYYKEKTLKLYKIIKSMHKLNLLDK